MNKKTIIISASVIVVLILAAVLVRQRPWDGPPPQTTVAVRLNAPFPAIDFAPFYVAKTKGWLEASLASVSAKPDYVGSFGEIALSNESLAADRIDMLLTSEIPPIIGRSGGIDIKIVWLSCTLMSEITIPSSSSATDLGGLKGKKIATLAGSSSQYWLIKNLESSGLGRKYADIVAYSKPDDAMAAFETGNTYALALFPPFPEQEIVKGIAKPLPGPPAPIQVVMVSRGAFSRDHHDVVLAVTKALDQAKQWIIANPSEAKAIVAKETGIALNVVDLAWPRLVWTAKMDTALVKDIQDKADFLKSENKINNAVDVRKDLLLPDLIDTKAQ
jgi:sulfonate transport system substrate-binding protein